MRGIRPALPGANQTDAVFLNRAGRPLGVKSIQAMLPRLAAKAGLTEHVTPHALRRTCTTEMIRANANLWHVSEFLGHESPETLKSYVRLVLNDVRRTHAECHPREKDEE